MILFFDIVDNIAKHFQVLTISNNVSKFSLFRLARCFNHLMVKCPWLTETDTLLLGFLIFLGDFKIGNINYRYPKSDESDYNSSHFKSFHGSRNIIENLREFNGNEEHCFRWNKETRKDQSDNFYEGVP